MKRILVMNILLASTQISAEQLQSYNDIKNALSNGKLIRIVTDFSRCTSPNSKNIKLASAFGIFTANEIGFTDDHIATSVNHFTFNDPYFPNKAVIEYARYTIMPDNSMNVSLHVLEAKTYEMLMDKISFNCKINEATKIFV